MNPSDFTPTDEQQAIASAAALGSTSIMVPAYAGCAKTSTLALLAKRVKVAGLALAFNKKIALELEPKMGGAFNVRTMNGLGHRALVSSIGRLQLDDRKLGKIVTEVAKDRKCELSGEQWGDLRQLVSKAMAKGISPRDQGHPLAADTRQTWQELALDELGLAQEDFEFLYDLAREVLTRNNELTTQGQISFDDQIYYPTIMLPGAFTRWPLVVVDEAQDLSPLNHRMLELSLRPDGRVIAVGDKKQCHPPGTMIQLSRGKSKPVEELQVGDELVSYNRKGKFTGANTQGCKVTANNIFNFRGGMIRIMTEGLFAHDCTPNHKCLVKWTDKKGYCLYLMQKGNKFRIGIAQNWYTSLAGGFGPVMRARQEEADALWILECFESKEAALIAEKVIWTKYGLPDLIFKCSGRLSSTQEHLDKAWEQIGDNSKRAKACLAEFWREFDFPFWIKGEHTHIGEKSFLTQACNLISGAMEVKVFDGSIDCSTWLKVWIDHYQYSGPVIGITVESNGYGQHLYVANGIVTHNSIYAFRGAHTESMEQIRTMRQNWQTLPLTMTFRCPKVVVARQQAHAPGFRAAESNRPGSFRQQIGGEDGWGVAELLALSSSPTVLCRNNGPLMALAFKLLRQGVGCQMAGRDIGKSLERLAKDIIVSNGKGRKFDESLSAEKCAGMIEDWKVSQVSLAEASQRQHLIDGIEDRAECLQAVLQNTEVKDSGGLVAMLRKLFARDQGQVLLSSIHRAKGLEWDQVVHLDSWRVPSKQAKLAAKAGDGRVLAQERNLAYVCETRTKDMLVEANLKDFKGD